MVGKVDKSNKPTKEKTMTYFIFWDNGKITSEEAQDEAVAMERAKGSFGNAMPLVAHTSNRLRRVLGKKTGFFPITSVSRMDVKSVLDEEEYNVSKISDEEMRLISNRMADAYCDFGYHEQLETVVEDMKTNHWRKENE